MKYLNLIVLLSIFSQASIAGTMETKPEKYGSNGNFQRITVIENTMAECEKKFAELLYTYSRSKALISADTGCAVVVDGDTRKFSTVKASARLIVVTGI